MHSTVYNNSIESFVYFHSEEGLEISSKVITSSSNINNQTTTRESVVDIGTSDISTARLNKFRQLARCFFYVNCQMEWSSGALVAMNLFSPYEKLSKQPNQKWQLRFCEDSIDFIYQTKEKSNPNYEYIKRLPANFIDKSVIITTSSDGFVLYIQMKGNVIELISEFVLFFIIEN